MINNILRSIIYFVVCALLQILILNNVHFLRVATPFVYLYFIVKLPVGMPKSQVIFLSFLMGLVIDIFGNTPGMHAAACTMTGFSRDSLISFFAGKDLPDGIFPSFKTFTYGVYFRYVLSLVIIHHSVLFFIESLTLFDPLFLFIRLGASVGLTTLIILIAETFNLELQRSEE